MTEFEKQVYTLTQLVPKGKVTTYAEIAKQIKDINLCRAVGNALHKNPFPYLKKAEEYTSEELKERIPCHRVVNSKGIMASNFGLNGPSHQAEMLLQEGVQVVDGKVDLSKYLQVFK